MAGPAASTERRAPRQRVRLEGIDLARGLAFAGMLLAHFAFARPTGDPGWLQVVDQVADGRAAPLFCVLLGLGAGLLVASGASDRVLVIRGALLGALGLAIWPFVGTVYLILPHYGLLLAVVPLLRRLPTAWLLPTALVAFAVPSVITAIVDDHGLRGASQPDAYGELADLGFLARHLLWTGGYPLVGWVGFVLVGLWLSHLPLGSRRVQLALLVGGTAVALLQPLARAVHEALAGRPATTSSGTPSASSASPADGLATFFDGAAHSNQLAWYVLSSASAVAVIGGCLLLVALVPGPWKVPLVRLGQLALTVYVLHLLIGEQWVWPWISSAQPTLTVQVLVVLVVLAGLTAFATAWRVPFRRGPLEAAVRALSG